VRLLVQPIFEAKIPPPIASDLIMLNFQRFSFQLPALISELKRLNDNLEKMLSQNKAKTYGSYNNPVIMIDSIGPLPHIVIPTE